MAKLRKQKPRREKPKRDRPPPQRGLMALLHVEPGPWAYWLVLIAAFGWAFWANTDMRDGQATLKWPETTGTIAESKVVRTTSGSSSSGNSGRAGGHTSSSSSTSWNIEVSYRYEVAGQALSGERIGWGTKWSYGNERDAQAKLRQLAPGSKVAVFYDPRRPSQSLLVRGGATGKLVAGVIMAGFAAGLLILSKLRQRPVKQHLPPNKRSGPMIRRAILGGLVATAVFGGLQYLVYLKLFV
ncbi:MAG: DUF3592 domain-containing protein [Deltaproteobacteria bacterium]|nr:DUF3592 domain-containing protein [Deltaproteobacteria bacterium]